MTEKEMAKNNKIMECRVGSHLYGTNTETSDEDFAGVFIADLKYYFGLKNIEEVSDNVVSKQENGKNNKDAIDKKYTELRRFVQLALQNNPNVVELLFCNDSNIIYQNEAWKKLVDNREYFLSSKQVKDRFKGYAFSQKHKMKIKLENYDILKDAYDILNNSDKRFLVDEDNFKKFEFRENINTEFRIADIFIPRNLSIKRAKDLVGERLGRVGNRQELILKHGFDVKFAANLTRILMEGLELLQYKTITFPLKERQLILDIKKGKYTCDQVLNMADDLESQIDNLKITEFKQDYNKVESVLIEILSNKFNF